MCLHVKIFVLVVKINSNINYSVKDSFSQASQSSEYGFLLSPNSKKTYVTLVYVILIIPFQRAQITFRYGEYHQIQNVPFV